MGAHQVSLDHLPLETLTLGLTALDQMDHFSLAYLLDQCLMTTP
jgi:hypothetical protein